jgi:hypothetical protein
VHRTAIAPTTSNQNGGTPKPGMASRASPGNSNHCRPSTMKSSSAVARSATHPIGGSGFMKAPMASEMPAVTKASASCFLENVRDSKMAPSSLHRTRFGNHVARFSDCASCGKTGKARQPFAAFQSAGAGSTCRTLRCFQHLKLEKGRSWWPVRGRSALRRQPHAGCSQPNAAGDRTACAHRSGT